MPRELRTYKVPGEDDRESAREHEEAERDVLLASGAARCQQHDAVDGGEQEPGEAAGDEEPPARPSEQGSDARCGLDVFLN
jgi:hypothetical protein